jgi:2-polyprenyl-3-methyl-5-hydroxy-6-metoxy-1,4-benzoquinol methylase
MMRKTAADFFDAYASDFDAIYGGKNSFIHRLINRFLRKSMRLRYLKTIEGCRPIEGRTVLDVGCGPGHYCAALAERGAAHVCGIDFAEGMIDLANRNAVQRGVADRCEFIVDDFLARRFEHRFDYTMVMGFMDYVDVPRKVIDKVLSLTADRAFFSFPAAGGLLAWQREMRYRRRCRLYLYHEEQIAELFIGAACERVEIERISRDFFVTVHIAADRAG